MDVSVEGRSTSDTMISDIGTHATHMFVTAQIGIHNADACMNMVL